MVFYWVKNREIELKLDVDNGKLYNVNYFDYVNCFPRLSYEIQRRREQGERRQQQGKYYDGYVGHGDGYEFEIR